MNPLEYIQQQNPKIPLKVDRISLVGSAFASTDDISLPLYSGKEINTFFIPPNLSKPANSEPLSVGTFILATWGNPGRCSFDNVKNVESDYGVISQYSVIDAERFFSESLFLRMSLRLVNADGILSSQNIDAIKRVFDDINRLFPKEFESVIELFSKDMRIQEPTFAVQQKMKDLEAALEQQGRAFDQETQAIQALTENRNNLAKCLEEEIAHYNKLHSDLDSIRSSFSSHYPIAAALLDRQTESSGESPQGRIPYQELITPRLQPSFLDQAMTLTTLLSGLTGSLGLLHGSVGVGKTHAVRQASHRLEAALDVIPVRPSWVEPADLLGYYDPLAAIFRPGPFTEALKRHGSRDLLHVICLDELNLARIENYAADLLSRMEYSKQDADAKTTVQLYSDADYAGLAKEMELLSGIHGASPEQIRRRTLLEGTLLQYPSRMLIPNGLALLGTLNADETTFDLSPKVIDRAYCLHFPPASMQGFPAYPGQSSQPSASGGFRWSKLQRDWRHHLEVKVMDHLWKPLYEILSSCNFSEIGLMPGRRFQEDFRAVMALAMTLSLPAPDAIAFFIWAKLLPRISYRPDDRRHQLLNRLLERLRQEYDITDPAWRFTLQSLQNQINDPGVPMVRYFGIIT